MRSPNGLKNMTDRNARDPYKRLAMQVFLDCIRTIRKAVKVPIGHKDYDLAQHTLRREVGFLKHGIGAGGGVFVTRAPALFHEILNMEWLMDMEEDKILDLVTKNRIPRSWRKEGLL